MVPHLNGELIKSYAMIAVVWLACSLVRTRDQFEITAILSKWLGIFYQLQSSHPDNYE